MCFVLMSFFVNKYSASDEEKADNLFKIDRLRLDNKAKLSHNLSVRLRFRFDKSFNKKDHLNVAFSNISQT